MFQDPILKILAKKYPPPDFSDRSELLYESLIREIIGQQLHTKAARAIFKRFKELFTEKNFPEPQDILVLDDETLRTVGMSYAKVQYIKSIAQTFADKKIDVARLNQLSDEEVIAELIKIKGVGRWTAEMVLIFTLKRPDVFSLGDLGLRRAIEKLYGISDKKEILHLSETWKPYRSTACWYLWRSLENE